jgi:hypothetical protein
MPARLHSPCRPFHVSTPQRLQLVLATCYVITHITDLFGDLQQLAADLQWLINNLFGISRSLSMSTSATMTPRFHFGKTKC